MKNKNEEKCCADCKHCIIRYLTPENKRYYCELTEEKDMVSGEMNYQSCYVIWSTDKCKFEKSYFKMWCKIIFCTALVIISLIYYFVG